VEISRYEESSCGPIPDELETSNYDTSYITEVEFLAPNSESERYTSRENITNAFNSLNQAARQAATIELIKGNDQDDDDVSSEKRPVLAPIVTSDFYQLKSEDLEETNESIIEFSSQEVVNFGELFGKSYSNPSDSRKTEDQPYMLTLKIDMTTEGSDSKHADQSGMCKLV
jgi:uncharacterized protein YegP (UPF0339 family)